MLGEVASGGHDRPSTHRVTVDPQRCCGHGRCYSLVPELFDSDDAGYAVVRSTEIGEQLVQRALGAATACPEQAIAVTPVREEEGRK
jgi:ferredoxin